MEKIEDSIKVYPKLSPTSKTSPNTFTLKVQKDSFGLDVKPRLQDDPFFKVATPTVGPCDWS